MAKIGYFNSVLSNQGQPILATITVYEAGTEILASLWVDAPGTIVKDNPFQTDELGRLQFYAAAGTYDIRIAGTGITAYTIEGQQIGLPFAGIVAAASGRAISAEECHGQVISNSEATGDVEFDLPAAAVGMLVTFFVAAAHKIKLDPNGTDRIMVLTSAAGDYLESDAVVGSFISLICLTAGQWQMVGRYGAWTEE